MNGLFHCQLAPLSRLGGTNSQSVRILYYKPMIKGLLKKSSLTTKNTKKAQSTQRQKL